MGDERRPRIAVSCSRVPGGGVARLASFGDVVAWPGDVPPTPAQLRELVRGCDAALVFGDDVVDAAFLDAAGKRLRVVALASAEFDTVDQMAARARGVVVTSTPSVLAETAADAVICLMLMSRRRICPPAGSPLGLDLHGGQLGLVGYGPVARAVARRALGFDMSIQHYDPSEPDNIVSRSVALDELLATSDVVSLHVPAAPRTRGLIGARELALMKPTATLVSIYRDGVLDETALLAALRAGTVHSAGLDVVGREPSADDASLDAPNLVVLPYLGAASEATRAAMVDLAARNVLAVLEGSDALTPLPGTAGRSH